MTRQVKALSKGLASLSIVMVFSACANHPCVHVRNPELAAQAGAQPVTPVVSSSSTVANSKEAGAVTSKLNEPATTVVVYKADGSLQCGAAKGQSVEEMEKQLKGFKVLSRDKRPDGKMHIQVCGSPTGFINVYEIPELSLKAAEALGFKKL